MCAVKSTAVLRFSVRGVARCRPLAAVGHFLVRANTDEIRASFQFFDTLLMNQDGILSISDSIDLCLSVTLIVTNIWYITLLTE